jgi:hypothetical protein
MVKALSSKRRRRAAGMLVTDADVEEALQLQNRMAWPWSLAPAVKGVREALYQANRYVDSGRRPSRRKIARALTLYAQLPAGMREAIENRGDARPWIPKRLQRVVRERFGSDMLDPNRHAVKLTHPTAPQIKRLNRYANLVGMTVRDAIRHIESQGLTVAPDADSPSFREMPDDGAVLRAEGDLVFWFERGAWGADADDDVQIFIGPGTSKLQVLRAIDTLRKHLAEQWEHIVSGNRDSSGYFSGARRARAGGFAPQRKTASGSLVTSKLAGRKCDGTGAATPLFTN